MSSAKPATSRARMPSACAIKWSTSPSITARATHRETIPGAPERYAREQDQDLMAKRSVKSPESFLIVLGAVLVVVSLGAEGHEAL
jgi:hypothetical protein